MSGYTRKPAQFRLPAWAHEFIAEESASSGISKTDVVLEALESYRRSKRDDLLADGYREYAAENVEAAKAWEGTLGDGLEPGEW